MGNLIVGVPFGGSHGFGIRPYGFAGVGLMQTHGDITAGANIDENSFSWDFGGGAMMFFGDRYGMRFDVRYLRTFDDLEIAGIQLADNPGKLDFTRTSFGFIFRF
jgi:opacity protein-like surface antigen